LVAACLPQDFASSKLRLLVAAGLGILAINEGASAAFNWYYHKQGASFKFLLLLFWKGAVLQNTWRRAWGVA